MELSRRATGRLTKPRTTLGAPSGPVCRCLQGLCGHHLVTRATGYSLTVTITAPLFCLNSYFCRRYPGKGISSSAYTSAVLHHGTLQVTNSSLNTMASPSSRPVAIITGAAVGNALHCTFTCAVRIELTKYHNTVRYGSCTCHAPRQIRMACRLR